MRCQNLVIPNFLESIFEQCTLHLVNALQVNHIRVLKLLSSLLLIIHTNDEKTNDHLHSSTRLQKKKKKTNGKMFYSQR